MSDTVIRAENLGKKYVIGHQQEREKYTALRDVIASSAKGFVNRFRSPGKAQCSDSETFWALKDVSFNIKQGERIGIIGRNGAGKSTLLKILSRITEPTEGRISIRGRVASLLEVGTGFHPELTGRENMYLNGAILGMSKAEIRRKFDEIVAFAEVEKFLDTPVKRYSSGMYVRLAFAIAAHLEPEILVVDEVLAVGDIRFQKKCLGKMQDVGREGRTVLFVSHNMSALKSLCNSAILLSNGELEYQGNVLDAVNTYLSSSVTDSAEGEIFWTDRALAPGSESMRLCSIRLLDKNLSPKNSFEPSETIEIEIVYETSAQIRSMRIVVQVVNAEGLVIFASTDHEMRKDNYECPGKYKSTCLIPRNLMNSGLYYVKVHAGCPGIQTLVKSKEFISFNIEKGMSHGSVYSENWPGIVSPALDWNLCKLAPLQK